MSVGINAFSSGESSGGGEKPRLFPSDRRVLQVIRAARIDKVRWPVASDAETCYRASANKNTMPTYEYECEKCGRVFEAFQSMKDAPLEVCTDAACGGKVKRLLGTGAGLIFKGSGFYITDYRSEGYKKAAKSESGTGSEGSGSGGASGGSSGGTGSSGGSSGGPATSPSTGSGSSSGSTGGSSGTTK